MTDGRNPELTAFMYRTVENAFVSLVNDLAAMGADVQDGKLEQGDASQIAENLVATYTYHVFATIAEYIQEGGDMNELQCIAGEKPSELRPEQS